MKSLILILGLVSLLGGCAIGQDIYDNRRLDECRDLPTPDERRDCERAARDHSAGIPVSG